MGNLFSSRREYAQKTLSRNDLHHDPIKFFAEWMQQAQSSDIVDPTAMVLATSDASQQLHQRTVLLKSFDEKGFVFYSDRDSNKAKQMQQNPNVSLLFPWYVLERQAIIKGTVEVVSQKEADEYFLSRPKASQIAAWASEQSQIIESRDALEKDFDTMQQRFEQEDMKVPKSWCGYRVIPTYIEFWQGGEKRLHDRFFFIKEDGVWQEPQRLSP